MQATILHNDVDISSYVISYSREQKVCNGIGLLELVLEKNIGRIFDPYDIIVIYELDYNSQTTFKAGTYYVSSQSDSDPEGNITVSCQDGSKMLVDYFIAESYTITTAETNKYWIEKFLNEAGVSYYIPEEETGSLISNLTNMGLCSAYEQISQLLLMSGWYMYFSPEDVLIIGPKDIDFEGDPAGEFDRESIITISTNTDDKMLRNRFLVYGGWDAENKVMCAADVSTTTPWNYDSDDVRTAVMANSYIPNNAVAHNLASRGLAELAQITYTKTLDVTWYRNLSLGDVIYIESDVYTGIGVITTIGSELSSKGYITKIICDERCPRLFGYFNYGDFVYIGTKSKGVWRKPLTTAHTWSDYSTGISDLNVTDLYKNNGVLSCVTSSGQAYYRVVSKTYWNRVTVTGLSASGILNEETQEVEQILVSSGIMARAVTQDRKNNHVHLAVDNREGANEAGYYSPSGVLFSGIFSWVLDVDPKNGRIVDTTQVVISGEYESCILDIDNDGKNDYVSLFIPSSGTIVPGTPPNLDFGHSDCQLIDNTGVVSLEGAVGDSLDILSVLTGTWSSTQDPRNFSVSDVPGSRYIAFFHGSTFKKININDSAIPFTVGTTETMAITGLTKAYGLLAINDSTFTTCAEFGTSDMYFVKITLGASYTSTLMWDGSTLGALLLNGFISNRSMASHYETDNSGSYPGTPTVYYVNINMVTGSTGQGIVTSKINTATDVYKYVVSTHRYKNVTPVLKIILMHWTLGTGWHIEETTYTTFGGGSIGVEDYSIVGGARSAVDSVISRVDYGQIGETYRDPGTSICTLVDVDIPHDTFFTFDSSGITLKAPVSKADSISGSLYIYGQVGSDLGFMSYDTVGNQLGFIKFNSSLSLPSSDSYILLSENFMLGYDYNDPFFRFNIYYILNYNANQGPGGSTYVVAKKNNKDFEIVHTGSQPFRVDSSTGVPIVIVASGVSSIAVYDQIYDDVFQNINITYPMEVHDYRNTNISSSGTDFKKNLLFTLSGALNYMGLEDFPSKTASDISTYAVATGVFLEKVETSNYKMPGQYIFVCDSGCPPKFYQQNPTESAFTLHVDNIPSGFINIIRLDDRI